MFSVLYQKVKILLPFNPRRGRCKACGRGKEEGVNRTAIHHFRYAYNIETVKNNPEYVLHNTLELCYPDHLVADSLRVFTELSPKFFVRVLKALPREETATLISKFKQIIVQVEENGEHT